jgi:hypothetical protein
MWHAIRWGCSYQAITAADTLPLSVPLLSEPRELPLLPCQLLLLLLLLLAQSPWRRSLQHAYQHCYICYKYPVATVWVADDVMRTSGMLPAVAWVCYSSPCRAPVELLVGSDFVEAAAATGAAPVAASKIWSSFAIALSMLLAMAADVLLLLLLSTCVGVLAAGRMV